MRTTNRANRFAVRAHHWAAGLALALALVPNFGCGREFFRQWADQDVSESIFEKSRDPRFRLDGFSIEPPALARFADPYDVDRPPAPPDDHTVEALTPTPQWPHHKLLTPNEGTGYLDMLDRGRRYEFKPKSKPVERMIPDVAAPPPGPIAAPPFQRDPRRDGGVNPPAGEKPKTDSSPLKPEATPPKPGETLPPTPDTAPPANAPRTGNRAPASNSAVAKAVAGNSGTSPKPLTPIQMPTAQPASRSAPESAQMSSVLSPSARASRAPKKDAAVYVVEFQEPNPPDAPPADDPLRPRQPDANQRPLPDIDPDPRSDQDVRRGVPRFDLTPEEAARARAASASFAAMLTPGVIDFNEAAAAGIPTASRPYIIGPVEAMQLGLINSRVYQSRIENVYTNALTVTLNRFAFEPQFYAGLSPVTGVATGTGGTGGSFPVGSGNPVNSFLYRTKEAIGGQASTFSLGEAAGWGKLFMFGGRLLMGFANQTVFNFTGTTPRQPVVQSFLPLTFIQPFLRGGGRAVTLEPLTQAERNLVYEIRSFARFRQQFMPFIMGLAQPVDATSGIAAGGAGGGAGGTPNDASIGYLQVLQQVQTVYNDRYNLAAFERVFELYREYAKNGASSGISQIQVDQIDQQIQQTRATLISDEQRYRLLLDQYKMQLGMPPDVPIVLDPGLILPLRNAFLDIERWRLRPDHDPEELRPIIASMPKLHTVLIDGRPLFKYEFDQTAKADKLTAVYSDPEKDEEFVLAAERVALENRLDLMNQRAQLYDSWRQLAVTANSLKGVFNVTLSNQVSTPSNTTNPFAFIDQAKQFSVVFNAELPLVRVSERNQFRSALIAYRSRQRLLQFQEDQVKFSVRQAIRNLIQFAEQYEINKLRLFVTIRQLDNTTQAIIAPPTQQDVNAAGAGTQSNQAAQTLNLIQSLNGYLGTQNSLVQTWISFETNRMALYRDLGILPFDEWEAYYEFFPANPAADGPGAGAGAVGIGAPAGGAANPPPVVRP